MHSFGTNLAILTSVQESQYTEYHFPEERNSAYFHSSKKLSRMNAILCDIDNTELVSEEHVYRMFRVFLFRNSPKKDAP